jgi:hypothetical protein
MKSVVDWVLAHRYRLILLATVLAPAPLLQVLSAALIALETARSGVALGLVAAAICTGGVVLLSLVAGTSAPVIGAVAASVFVSGVVLGAMLRAGGGIRLAFQGTILLSVVAVLAISFVGPGPTALLAPILDRMAEVLQERGATPAQMQAFRQAEPVSLGLFAAAAMTQLLGALFLAEWWRGLAEGNSRFGFEFRDLKLGLVLGFPATILVVIGLVLQAPVVQNLTPLALFAFLFQGLSVMHAWAYAKHWHPMYLVPVYVLLVSPFVILILSGVGLVDNWFDLRAPLRGRR